jgi:hypothetical protein
MRFIGSPLKAPTTSELASAQTAILILPALIPVLQISDAWCKAKSVLINNHLLKLPLDGGVVQTHCSALLEKQKPIAGLIATLLK